MDLLPLIKPSSIAIIGASRDINKIGAQITQNLLKNQFQGTIYPINPKAETVQGLQAFDSVQAVQGSIDLAIIAIPKQFVSDAVKSCIEKKVGSIIVISAGFKEVDQEGASLERDIANSCKKAGIPLLGPNCLGIINPKRNCNASFTAQMPPAGEVTFISQSGAFGTAAIDWAAAHNLGFNLFVSLGNKAVLNENHFLQTVEPSTKVIAMYLEDIANGEQFMETAATVTKSIPIVLMKPGKSKKAQEAAKSHTGALTGSDSVVSTACNQSGILRVDSSQDLFDVIKAFSLVSELKGNKVAIITNAGGPSIMATDTLEEAGLELATLSEQTQNLLKQYLPRESNIHDPIDLIGDAKADRYDHALEVVLAEKQVDACIVLLTPQSSTEVEKTAQSIIKYAQSTDKPVLAAFTGGAHIEKAVHILNTHKVACFEFPEQAVRTLGKVWYYYKTRNELANIKSHTTATFIAHPMQQNLINSAIQDNRTFLLQHEVESLLKEVNIQFPIKKIINNQSDAYKLAKEIGTPVVMKISSPAIIHKTEAHAVALNLNDQEEIEDAWQRLSLVLQKNGNNGLIYLQKQIPKSLELLVGMKRDTLFGPVIVFGSGGIYTELYSDTAARIAPLGRNAAKAMIQETKISKILNGYRGGEKYDQEGLELALMGLSNLAKSYPQISEIDINPLLLINGIPTALDARILLNSKK